MTQRYKMTLSYDGTAYAGWQVQPGRPTVQAAVELAVLGRTGESQRVCASGRTDTGVHARAQVTHFDLERPIDANHLVPGLLAYLPPDIRVEAIEEAESDFHAQRSTVGKQYRYRIWNARVMRAYYRNYRAHVAKELNIDAMNEAAASLVGTHDFLSYSSNPNRPMESTVRTIRTLVVTRKGPDTLIVVEGSGFLYKMVRSLAGFLIRVGQGDEAPEEAKKILEAKERTARVPTAHPQGLYLWEVYYATL